MASEKTAASPVEIAQFRFALIAPVIQGLYPDVSRAAYYRRVTEKPLVFPDGTERVLSYKTLEKWVSDYKRLGFDALMPKPRSDKGSSRALADTAMEEIYRLKQNFPRLNATQIHASLVQNGFITARVNVCTVQRFMKRHGLRGANHPALKDRKAFEEDAFGNMWQTDTCFFPHITVDGRSQRVYAICIIDDHSRLIVGGGLFFHDSAANFQAVFKEAVAAYGIPAKLYTDNGAPYANEQLALICGQLGTVLLHAKVRDGASKGKIERFWRTAKERWLYGLDIDSISSLEDFDFSFREYLHLYNHTLHSSIGCTPFERYREGRENLRLPQSSDWLDECFLNRITRKVRKDATVSIDKVSYDVPMQFIAQTVEIRYRPGDMDSAFILSQEEHYPIRLSNKNENCRAKRQNPPPIDYTAIGGETHVQGPLFTGL